MRYIQGTSRYQATLFPEVLDDFIDETNPARVIDAFIDGLDLVELGFTHSETKDKGRKPYSPGDLLKLYIYGHLNRIRSSRSLETATQRNIEVMWLLNRLTPDFKTIADFRKDNSKGLKRAFREFIFVCKKLDLLSGELIAIDGSKFKADNHSSKSYNQDKINKLLEKIDEKVATYLETLDSTDKDEDSKNKINPEELQDKIKSLKKHKKELQEYEKSLQESGETQISLTDKDSRKMRVSTGGSDMCFNAQTAVDEKHKLIVCAEVTNDINDQNQLSSIAEKAKEILGVDSMDVVADAGYFKFEEIKGCQDQGIECYVPRPRKSANAKKGLFTNRDFHYYKDNDCYICPAQQELTYRGTWKKRNRQIKFYEASGCNECPLKSKCTTSKYNNRRIERWVHEDILEDMQQRLEKNPQMMELRKQLVEHPFGTIKHWMGHRHFLTRGFEKVSGEFALAALTYNMRRVINIIGVKELVKMLAQMSKKEAVKLLKRFFKRCENKLMPSSLKIQFIRL